MCSTQVGSHLTRWYQVKLELFAKENTLAYLVELIYTEKEWRRKMFYNITHLVDVILLITDKDTQLAGAFVPGKLFQTDKILASQAWTYPSGAPLE